MLYLQKISVSQIGIGEGEQQLHYSSYTIQDKLSLLSAAPEDNSQKDRQVVKEKTKENIEDDKFIAVLNKSIENREKKDISNQDEERLFMLS
ncbi:hypothetical protein HHI36_005343 [Cryptolaemus montrouzieri]|uniref:Uncharacterized protein n=1 Tax=Cryptolaemus montrouzieri TaxID=559131 RepID=A0ABD2NTX9_9CUCU